MSGFISVLDCKAREIDADIGMNDRQAFLLKQFIVDTWKINNLRIEIDYLHKEITIIPTSTNGNYIKMKPKRPELLDEILTFLRIDGYTMRFWE